MHSNKIKSMTCMLNVHIFFVLDVSFAHQFFDNESFILSMWLCSFSLLIVLFCSFLHVVSMLSLPFSFLLTMALTNCQITLLICTKHARQPFCQRKPKQKCEKGGERKCKISLLAITQLIVAVLVCCIPPMCRWPSLLVVLVVVW